MRSSTVRAVGTAGLPRKLAVLNKALLEAVAVRYLARTALAALIFPGAKQYPSDPSTGLRRGCPLASAGLIDQERSGVSRPMVNGRGCWCWPGWLLRRIRAAGCPSAAR